MKIGVQKHSLLNLYEAILGATLASHANVDESIRSNDALMKTGSYCRPEVGGCMSIFRVIIVHDDTFLCGK